MYMYDVQVPRYLASPRRVPLVPVLDTYEAMIGGATVENSRWLSAKGLNYDIFNYNPTLTSHDC